VDLSRFTDTVDSITEIKRKTVLGKSTALIGAAFQKGLTIIRKQAASVHILEPTSQNCRLIQYMVYGPISFNVLVAVV